MARWTIIEGTGMYQKSRDTDDIMEVVEAEKIYLKVIDNQAVAEANKNMNLLLQTWKNYKYIPANTVNS